MSLVGAHHGYVGDERDMDEAQRKYSQLADRDLACAIAASDPRPVPHTLWRGQEWVRRYEPGDVLDLTGRSFSEDRDVAVEFAFGTHGDSDSQLVVAESAAGVRLHASVFGYQREWLVAGIYRVHTLEVAPADEIDQVVRLEFVRLAG